MDGVYLPSSKRSDAASQFLKARITYRATIYRDGRPFHMLKDKFNIKDDVDKFLDEYWPGELGYRGSVKGRADLELKVWQYVGGRMHRMVIYSRMPEP